MTIFVLNGISISHPIQICYVPKLSSDMDIDKDKITKWFYENFQVHNDWTGSWVEYDTHCDSVSALITKFFNDMQNHF